MQAKRDDDRVNLRVRSVVSLHHQSNHANARQSAGGRGATIKSIDTDLPPGAEEVDHLLYRARAVHVERDRNEVLCDALADDVPLLIRGVLQKLLAEVVAERIYVHIVSATHAAVKIEKGSYRSSAQRSDRRSPGRSCHGARARPLRASSAGSGNRAGPCTG